MDNQSKFQKKPYFRITFISRGNKTFTRKVAVGVQCCIFMEESCFCMPNILGTNVKNFKNIFPSKASYMFKKKSCIIKRIWKFSKLSITAKEQSQEISDIKRKLHSLFKSLNDEDLDVLLKTLQSSGGIESDCICIKTSEYRYISRRTANFDPRKTLARAFRFPQMKDESLRTLPCCCNHKSCNDTEVCINPYHSSLVVDSEPPLPPYTEVSSSQVHTPTEPTQRGTDEVSSASSSSSTYDSSLSASSLCKSLTQDSSLLDSDRDWCRITYWEEKYRIGRIFDVSEDCINVFESLPHGSGLCLPLLAQSGVPKNESSQKVQEHIGYGFQLTRESDGVWLYNRSDIVLFAGSPTIQLEGVNLTQPFVKRLPPGTSVIVYDPTLIPEVLEKNMQLQEKENSVYSFSKTSTTAHSQPFCVRVSFGKGWGKNYTRMSITQCPCWVEIYLNV